jgi:hypothetical protein
MRAVFAGNLDPHGEGAAKPRVSNHEARDDCGLAKFICDSPALAGRFCLLLDTIVIHELTVSI